MSNLNHSGERSLPPPARTGAAGPSATAAGSPNPEKKSSSGTSDLLKSAGLDVGAPGRLAERLLRRRLPSSASAGISLAAQGAGDADGSWKPWPEKHGPASGPWPLEVCAGRRSLSRRPALSEGTGRNAVVHTTSVNGPRGTESLSCQNVGPSLPSLSKGVE